MNWKKSKQTAHVMLIWKQKQKKNYYIKQNDMDLLLVFL